MKIISVALLFICLFEACSNSGSEPNTDTGAFAVVSVTKVQRGIISDFISLSATTFYLSNHQIAAPVSGYITKAGMKPGEQVKEGQVLFELKTREATVLQSATGSEDVPDLGLIQMKAPTNGFLSTVSHVKDDFVQEGEMLGQIVKPEDLYIKLFVPYEYRSAISENDRVEVKLPSGDSISTSVSGTLNQTDSATQSMVWLLKPDRMQLLPEGLNLVAVLETDHHKDTQLLPKEAVLSDETLQSFWVMKIVDDTLAVNVPVTKGIESEDKIEILSPEFFPDDQIIHSGQYGLEDSTRVQIRRLDL